MKKALHVSGGGEDWDLKFLYSNKITFYSISSVMSLLMTDDAIDAMQDTIFFLLPWYLAGCWEQQQLLLYIFLAKNTSTSFFLYAPAIFSCAECVSNQPHSTNLAAAALGKMVLNYLNDFECTAKVWAAYCIHSHVALQSL